MRTAMIVNQAVVLIAAAAAAAAVAAAKAVAVAAVTALMLVLKVATFKLEAKQVSPVLAERKNFPL